MLTTMHRTQIYLTPTHMRRLRGVAGNKRVTVSHVIRTLLEKELGVHAVGPRRSHRGLLGVATRINAKGIRAPKNLAARLDHYLYGRK